MYADFDVPELCSHLFKVVGLISPWNLPLYLLTWKIAPAIAVGNTCICKPSEFTSLTAWMLADVMTQAGLPNVLSAFSRYYSRFLLTFSAYCLLPGVLSVMSSPFVINGRCLLRRRCYYRGLSECVCSNRSACCTCRESSILCLAPVRR